MASSSAASPEPSSSTSTAPPFMASTASTIAPTPVRKTKGSRRPASFSSACSRQAAYPGQVQIDHRAAPVDRERGGEERRRCAERFDGVTRAFQDRREGRAPGEVAVCHEDRGRRGGDDPRRRRSRDGGVVHASLVFSSSTSSSHSSTTRKPGSSARMPASVACPSYISSSEYSV